MNEKGLDFYRRLTDALLKHGITPHATLFHWDSPQALEDRYGSWRSREMAKDFADYVHGGRQRLGDRVQHWMTINEIICFTTLGYGVGKVPQHAPGTVVKTRKEVLQTVHHALLAHGLGCQAVRAAAPGLATFRSWRISTVCAGHRKRPSTSRPLRRRSSARSTTARCSSRPSPGATTPRAGRTGRRRPRRAEQAT